MSDTANSDTVNTARTWRTEGRSGVLVCVLTARGLGTAANGDFTLVDEHDRFAGPVMGGALDTRLPAARAALVASGATSRMVTFPIDDRTADAAGLTCAGEVDVLLQRADTVPHELWDELAGGRPVALATVVGRATSSVHLANRAVLGGHEHAAIDAEVAQLAAQLLATPGNNHATSVVDGLVVVVQCWNPVPGVIILGPSALADALGAQFALLGWSATIVADGDDALRSFETSHPGDAVLVLDHSPVVSTPLLAAALRADRGYVGALGSRKTQVVRRTHLERAGATPDEVSRLHGPAGLDLGNRTPAETAVSIAAEIIAFRSGRSAQSLRATTGAITKAQPDHETARPT